MRFDWTNGLAAVLQHVYRPRMDLIAQSVIGYYGIVSDSFAVCDVKTGRHHFVDDLSLFDGYRLDVLVVRLFGVDLQVSCEVHHFDSHYKYTN